MLQFGLTPGGGLGQVLVEWAVRALFDKVTTGASRCDDILIKLAEAYEDRNDYVKVTENSAAEVSTVLALDWDYTACYYSHPFWRGKKNKLNCTCRLGETCDFTKDLRNKEKLNLNGAVDIEIFDNFYKNMLRDFISEVIDKGIEVVIVSMNSYRNLQQLVKHYELSDLIPNNNILSCYGNDWPDYLRPTQSDDKGASADDKGATPEEDVEWPRYKDRTQFTKYNLLTEKYKDRPDVKIIFVDDNLDEIGEMKKEGDEKIETIQLNTNEHKKIGGLFWNANIQQYQYLRTRHYQRSTLNSINI